MENSNQTTQSWAMKEAQALLDYIGGIVPAKGYVLFETGYGPSGLPHIGTFGEVVRTSMVRYAFSQISDIPTRLFCFSDDLDGLRKVPDNIPNREQMQEFIGYPLTSIPDPFGTSASYGEVMNTKLKAFLDRFGFSYEFKSATECYKKGEFNEILLAILHNYRKVLDIMLPTLGDERRASYSPFMPLCNLTGKVLENAVTAYHADRGMISYINSAGDSVETKVTDGACKLQWKADLGGRWAALNVDYEMYGKDLITSAALAREICTAIGRKPPLGFHYELFLDEAGAKISKSKGNGITIDQWLEYAPAVSLALYMYQSPKKAKRLSFDVIPKQMDDYLTYLNKYQISPNMDNPLVYVHNGQVPREKNEISFTLLQTLAASSNADNKEVLWRFIQKYNPNIDRANSHILEQMTDFAVKYYRDVVLPNKQYRKATEQEKSALRQLAVAIELVDADAESLQNAAYQVGKDAGYENLRDWFAMLYQVLLGADQGPRIGSFFALYGVDDSLKLIDSVARI